MDKDDLQLFTKALGDEKSPDQSWDLLKFSDREPKMVLRYVGWVDVMGASHMMQRSLDAASKSIGRLHEAVLKAFCALGSNDSVSLHPLADGVYVVADSYKDVADIFDRVFRSYAQTYLKMKSDSRFCPIRAAIAYGRVVDQTPYMRKLEQLMEKEQSKLPRAYFTNVLHGRAYYAAHEAEGKAPPFGIYHDESLREFGEIKDRKPATWPLRKWWGKNEISKDQQSFALVFGKRLLKHFEWMKTHPFDSGMSGEDATKKIDGYKMQIEEYFGLCDQPTSADQCGHSIKER